MPVASYKKRLLFLTGTGVGCVPRVIDVIS
jgi:hypothetical protein